MKDSDYQLELESKHKALDEQIEKLEHEREHDRSAKSKIKIQELKKEKLLIKDKLEEHLT